ncbi:MAG: HU family DNA-binding protein [Candidatus Aminicenantia bacterium]
MTKNDLVTKIAKDSGITKAQATKATNSLLNTIEKALKGGQKVTFVGFGTFKVVERKARNGRNPKTGEVIKIPKKKVPKFIPGKRLRERIK